ncbi:MAG: adenylate/guanylate cyclase domain-containing protein [Acidimicrobiales bacterium]
MGDARLAGDGRDRPGLRRRRSGLRARRSPVRGGPLHGPRRLHGSLGPGRRRGLARHAREPRPHLPRRDRPLPGPHRQGHRRRAAGRVRRPVASRERGSRDRVEARRHRPRRPAGIHAGEIEIRADGDIAGTAVNVAARVEQAAELGRVYVSSTVRDLLLGGDHRFAERGEHDLKGVEGSWRLYALET